MDQIAPYNSGFFGDATQANLGYVVSQMAHIEAKVYRKRYQNIQYPGLIPVDRSAPEWAKTVEYRQMDIAGEVRWTSDQSGDHNLVGTEYSRAITTVHMADLGYGFGMEEIAQARMLGLNLESDKAMAVKLRVERFIDAMAFVGNKEKGFTGLLNHPTTGDNAVNELSSNTTSGWIASGDPQLITRDVNTLVSSVHSKTNEISMADTLLIAYPEFAFLSEVQMPNTSLTLLEWIRRNNYYTATTGMPLTIKAIHRLKGARGTAANPKNLAVAYRRDEEVLKLHMPMPFRFLNLMERGLRYEKAGIFRMGGLDIRIGAEISYMTGTG